MSLCVLYNAICIPLRFSFDIYSNHHSWFIADYLWADFIYILDVVLINTHLQFTNNDSQVVGWALLSLIKIACMGMFSCSWRIYFGITSVVNAEYLW